MALSPTSIATVILVSSTLLTVPTACTKPSSNKDHATPEPSTHKLVCVDGRKTPALIPVHLDDELRPTQCLPPLQRKTRANTAWCENTSGVRHGTHVSRFESGLIGDQATYENGRLHGESISWGFSFILATGSISAAQLRKWLAIEKHKLMKRVSSIRPYRNGKPNGVATQWLHSGVKVQEGVYFDGKRDGVWCHWDKRGHLLAQDKLDHGTGTATQWWGDGKPMVRAELKNGMRHGLYQQWSSAGDKLFEKRFANDKEHGEQKQWGRAGRYLGSYTMVHGTGTETTWSMDGAKRAVVKFVEGVKHGSTRMYDKTKRLIREERWDHGKQVGEAKVFD